jgi:hypothetical protein
MRGASRANIRSDNGVGRRSRRIVPPEGRKASPEGIRTDRLRQEHDDRERGCRLLRQGRERERHDNADQEILFVSIRVAWGPRVSGHACAEWIRLD